MRDRITDGGTPRFWPPKPSRFWSVVTRPFFHYLRRRAHGIAEVNVSGLNHLADGIAPGDGVLVCPNHSYTGDGSIVIELGRRVPAPRRPLHFMAAWHVFRGRKGLDGWLLQRMGGFSVDREGNDRQSLRTAIALLSSGKSLLVFPEGEIYHLNERLTPLREGVAFMAASAQRDLDKSQPGARVWIVPAAIRYRFVEDVRPKLEAALAALEKPLMLRPDTRAPLHERVLRFGEMLLTIKEKEKLGRSHEHDGDLPARIGRLTEAILSRLESRHLKEPTGPEETTPVRVKLLRRQLLETLNDEKAAPADREAAKDALADVHLVLQLFSYPGNYVAASPTPERMAETIEKFEEDIHGVCRPKGRRRADVALGPPIDVKAQLGSARPRTAAVELTARLETAIQSLIDAGGGLRTED